MWEASLGGILQVWEFRGGRKLGGQCSAFWLSHYSPPVSREPINFPSYSLRTVTAQALQEKVDMILEKRALELVMNPGPGPGITNVLTHFFCTYAKKMAIVCNH